MNHARPVIALVLSALLVSSHAIAKDMFVYFGTHRSGPQVGFSVAHFDSTTGVLAAPRFLTEAHEPAFFVLTPDGRHLYACNGGAPGDLSSYSIDGQTGALTSLNRVPSGGAEPAYVSLDRSGRFAFVANYDAGTLAAFVLGSDGRLGDRTAYVQHSGHSINPQRQTRPHTHSIVPDPTNHFVLAADLGEDRLHVYRFDEKTGSLQPNDPPFAAITPGSGPRHVKFHPNGRWVYLINEMASTVIAFNWDPVRGALSEFQTISTLPSDFKGESTGAEIEVHPNGRFLYASNRGHDSLVVFAIDPASGRLSLVQHISSGGRTPRNFAFDPTGHWIVCTNHGSNNAVVFQVDGGTGRLSRVGDPVHVPDPFCARFLVVEKR